MDWSACDVVESVPERMGGIPVLRHTRMPADSVVDNFDDGLSAEEIAEDFVLDLHDVKTLLVFAHREPSVALAS